MELKTSQLENDVKLVKLIGRLDMQGTTAIEDQFTSFVSSKKAPVILDLSELEFLSSVGIRLFLINAKALSQRGGKMVFLNPNMLVSETMAMSGLDDMIGVYKTQANAIEAAQFGMTED